MLEETTEIEEDGPLDHRPFVDRYYLKKFVLSPTVNGGDLMILIHSNKLSLLTLAPSHPIIRGNFTITSVDFKVSNHLDRANNVVSGKGKRGAQLLSPKSLICNIECSNGKSFPVSSCLVAKLLEINERLQTEPGLLMKPDNSYIAILSQRVKDFETQTNSLVSEETYQELLNLRILKST